MKEAGRGAPGYGHTHPPLASGFVGDPHPLPAVAPQGHCDGERQALGLKPDWKRCLDSKLPRGELSVQSARQTADSIMCSIPTTIISTYCVLTMYWIAGEALYRCILTHLIVIIIYEVLLINT